MASTYRSSFRSCLPALLAAIALAGCGSDPTASGDVSSVEVSPLTADLRVGAAIPLTATVKDAGGSVMSDRSVVWTSSDGEVVTVSSTGLVTAHRLGTAQIAASAGGASGVATITVVPIPTASVVVEPAVVSLTVGETGTLAAVVRDETGAVVPGAAVSWSSSANGVALVSQSGVVTAASQGSATITASSSGKSGTAQVTVKPVPPPPPPPPPPPAPVASVAVNPSSFTLSTGESRQLGVTARDAGGNVLTGRAVSWSSSNGAVAGVSQSGVVTALVPGSATITANVEGVTGASAVTVQLAILPVARVEVTPASATVDEGDDVHSRPGCSTRSAARSPTGRLPGRAATTRSAR